MCPLDAKLPALLNLHLLLKSRSNDPLRSEVSTAEIDLIVDALRSCPSDKVMVDFACSTLSELFSAGARDEEAVALAALQAGASDALLPLCASENLPRHSALGLGRSLLPSRPALAFPFSRRSEENAHHHDLAAIAATAKRLRSQADRSSRCAVVAGRCGSAAPSVCARAAWKAGHKKAECAIAAAAAAAPAWWWGDGGVQAEQRRRQQQQEEEGEREKAEGGRRRGKGEEGLASAALYRRRRRSTTGSAAAGRRSSQQ